MKVTKQKFKTEVEMCRYITPRISGLLIPRKHKFVPEVPRFSHNNHADMLFIMDDGSMFVVEYKLSGWHELYLQTRKSSIPTIGIINANARKNNDMFRSRITPWIYGSDSEIERLHGMICECFGNQHPNHLTGSGNEAVYYWGYLKAKSSLDGGIKTGKRLSYFELYKRAICNLQEFYSWKLDFYLVYRVLGVYSVSVAKKHYKEAMHVDRFYKDDAWDIPNGRRLW